MTAADQLGSPLGGRLWPVTKKYWVLVAVLGTVAVCLYSTGTEWTLLNLQATSLSVGVHNKPHALNHLTSSGDSLGETANDTPDKNTTSSVEPSSSPPLPAPSTAHSTSTATTPSTGEHIITREHVAIVATCCGHLGTTPSIKWTPLPAATRVPRQLQGRTDLLVFAHRNVVARLPPSCVRLGDPSLLPQSSPPSHDRCYVVEHTPPADAYWHRYNFMFSLSFLAEPAYEPLLMSYDRLLRTDTDVVITPAFLTFRPRQFVVGRGGYMIEEYTKTRIKQLATDLHMTHQSLYNVGSTWFGNTSVTLLMVPKMLDVAKFILESPKYNQDEGFPRWHPNVASMYAGELVVNHFIPKENVWVNLDSLDINCNGHEKTADVYHSHCWPDLHMTHQGLYNVGSTWFGNTSTVLSMVPKMLEVAKFILDSPKYNVDQGFPRWHIGVTSMYAGELVVNHFIPKDNVWVNSESLDINCNSIEKTINVYHSHCWPGDQYPGYFNKWAFERGEYTAQRFPRDNLDLAVINDYFMAMALYGK
ncbi:hypothetical protein AaE_013633 [Aphanomyces astaci]|uniref:DUF7164 domain-containing protein n=1 Tax=Aphanomyces astaci TaxID=112090 RepID=A0A6A4Z977_APHAT|nr:hypothetical protein AaE_013633 [Aphanomyces astaci]